MVAAVVVGAKLAGVAAAVPLLVAGLAAIARFYFGVGTRPARRPPRSAAGGGAAGTASPARRKARPYRGPSSKRARADRERAERERPSGATDRERNGE